MPGPAVRTDIIEVYVFRRPSPAGAAATATRTVAGVQFLQLRRATPPMPGSWQPVMGHVEAGESAARAALRELAEETGFAPGHGLIGFWQLELVNSFYLASIDAVMLSPGFAAEVSADATPKLCAAHDASRWVARDHADRDFLWPGQRAAIAHIVSDILPPGAPMAGPLRIDPAKV